MSHDVESLMQSAQRWLGFAALFVAPTSLITGLCFFFGRVYLRSRFEYFGIDVSTLQLTTADYVVTVIKTYFFSSLRVLAVLALVVLLAVAVRRWAATGRRTKLLRVTAWLVLFLGALSFGNGAYWLAFEVLPIRWLIPTADATYTAWSIVLGTVLLGAGYWMLTISGALDGDRRRLPRAAERALAVLAAVTIVVALFWITDMYADELGKRDADFDARGLWTKPSSVQLDTPEVLSPPSRLVKTSALPSVGGSAPPTYRYECLRVIEARNGHYILLPAKWSRDGGWAVTVTPDTAHRVNAIVHEGLADRTGGGRNVQAFWQCPEVVRFFGETDLDQLLIGPDFVGEILGAATLTAGQIEDSMWAGPGWDPAATAVNDCAAQAHPAETSSALPPSDGAATRRLEMTGQDTSGPVWVTESVASLPTPAAADAMVQATQRRWAFCAGRATSIQRRGAAGPRILSRPGTQDDILAASDSAIDSAVADCAQAVGAKSNVVIEVDVCGVEEPLLATGVVAAIRQRIPQ
ncbi:sensor domain-containing protein [Mycolicibacterium agri]|nr:sensor domain-containing protein [Mycolicibacterium agri]GFG52557.1 hypothetical protein MAGR_39980 [Mycolicibacterium agri]